MFVKNIYFFCRVERVLRSVSFSWFDRTESTLYDFLFPVVFLLTVPRRFLYYSSSLYMRRWFHILCLLFYHFFSSLLRLVPWEICGIIWVTSLISFPEHEGLKVSYFDRSMSVIRRPSSYVVLRPSCVVRRAASTICFKTLLFLRQSAN